MRDCVDRRVTPPERVTSPTWGSPPPCKQARDSWPNYHLNHLPQRGRDFDTTITFNASTGEQYCDDWIINCMWLQVALDAKLVCVCFAPFLSFLQDQQARVDSLLRTEEFLPVTSLLLNAQRRGIWSISSHLNLFANRQMEQPNRSWHMNLSSS